MSKDTQHFNDNVPDDLRRKLHAIATTIKDDFISDCGAGESYGCSNINPVYGYHVSGFIPSQLGGYEVTEFYRNDADSSYHFTNAQSEFVNESVKRMYESFRADNPELNLPEDYSYNDLPPEAQSQFDDYERDWLEPALLRFEIWVDDNRAKLNFDQTHKAANTVYMRLSLAYSDAPYYRAKRDDETLGEWNFSTESVMKHKPEIFVKLLTKTVKEAV